MKSKALLLVALGVSLQSLTAPGGALAAADSKLCAQTRLHLQARLVAASPGGEDADALRGLSPRSRPREAAGAGPVRGWERKLPAISLG